MHTTLNRPNKLKCMTERFLGQNDSFNKVEQSILATRAGNNLSLNLHISRQADQLDPGFSRELINFNL